MNDINKRIEELSNIFDLIDNQEPHDIVLICRQVLEKAIDLIFFYKEVQRPKNAQLLELINNEHIQNFFGSDVIIDSLHFIRIVGINALHGKQIKKSQSKVAYNNTEYLIEIIKDKIVHIKEISEVSDEEITEKLKMNEENTRKIYIDLYLNESGWEVVPAKGKTKVNDTYITSGSVIPGKACCEIPVEGMNNKSGIGFCDYVLYGKDGKPLAVVEAKKTSESPEKGQQQVREYGKALKKKYEYIPVLYYTNGYSIFVVDGKYPPRKVAAFHTLKELELLIQRRDIKRITDISINDNITDRPYQKVAITKICERFNDMQRRALLVMATGTGKTRVAISIVDVLLRNNWIKNVLFLADRTSLVRQAFKNFDKLLPNMSFNVLSDPKLANTPEARITFSTHQTMINYIDSENKEFSIGRFDLIIIDEAHRSIFNKYGSIFSYFDSLLIGLTATPKEEVDANTYSIFNCESGIPNFSYSLQDGVNEKYLVPYKVVNKTTKLIKEGIKYSDLSQEDKNKVDTIIDDDIEDDDILPNSMLFRKIYNEGTCKIVLEDLMNQGLKVNQGQLLGKTIIFAYNHNHA
ncbi:MAG: DEAD/DEAH box helicase family protein, partial [Erysipelotrichaceae bacterium]